MNIDGTTGNKYQSAIVTRPYDFGTDAIERQRVSLGVSLIDADFEYGLQATKWQTYSDVRKMPSLFEIPGTELNNPSYPATVSASSSTVTISIPNVASYPVTSASSTTTGATLNLSTSGVSTIGTVTSSIVGINAVYTAIASSGGGGTGATFTVTRNASGAVTSVAIVNSGSGYVATNTITILGTAVGGVTPGNDITFPVSTVTNNTPIATVNAPTTFTSIAANQTYTNVAGTGGTGTNAKFRVVRNGSGVPTVTVYSGGSGYSVNDTITISGASVGGTDPTDNIIFTVASTGVNSILTIGSVTSSIIGANAVYTAVASTSSPGSGATFTVTRNASGAVASVVIVYGGTGYVVNNTITIPGTSVGGVSTGNDITFQVTSLSGATAPTIAIGQGVWVSTGSSSLTGAFSASVSTVSTNSITIIYPTQSGNPTFSGTVFFFYNTFPTAGQPLSIVGLSNANNDASRAEGIFLVATVLVTKTNLLMTYTAKVGAITTGTISTSYTSIRRAGFYGGQPSVSTPFTRIQTSSASQATQEITVTTLSNHGLLPGTPITLYNSGTGSDGNYIITNVATPTTFKYTTSGTITSGNFAASSTANIFVQQYSYNIHRPFDGGVLISPNLPTFGASVCRQSKKVFRYQSGKGLLWSSGTLFCPNNDIKSLTAASTTITLITSIPHGSPQPGAVIQIRGVNSDGYNGTYTVASVINSYALTVIAPVAPGVTTAILSDQSRFIVSNWHGSSVRAGAFDDQNGLFWEYDGQTLWVVKRACTFQLTGTVIATINNNSITGTGSKYLSQLRVNDRITIRGMTYTVTSIVSDTSIFVNPPYRGATLTVGVTACKVKEVRTPQNLFNRDTIDGRGPSGYNVDLTKMQMTGLQYTWYGAGFVDFMIRGSDGNWVFVHRYRQNNINDEAYMRTGNMPVRYEITNETTHAVSNLTATINSSVTSMVLGDSLKYWPPSGTVMIDNEYITYSAINGQSLTGLTRSSTLTYNIGDVNTALTGSAAAAHNAETSVNLVSCTCGPSLTHWGSAFLMDGNFDTDRGYFFNYQVNSVTSLSAGSTTNLFLLRLAPSVSNGIIGDLGQRDLLNRAQLLLQRLDVFGGSGTAGNGSTGSLVVSGILNPTGLTIPQNSWISINSPANGSQPSFAQVAVFPAQTTYGNYIVGSGERIFSTISNNGQNSIDLSTLKEVCNGVIGGNGIFPDGPDTLLVQLNVPAGFPTVTSYSVNLFWTEAQA